MLMIRMKCLIQLVLWYLMLGDVRGGMCAQYV